MNNLGLASEGHAPVHSMETFGKFPIPDVSCLRQHDVKSWPWSRIPGMTRASCTLAAVCLSLLQAGCDIRERSAPDLIWGVHGTKPGWLHKPRVAAFDAHDQLYIADLTDRIQVFDRDGVYLRGWRAPAFNVDGPSGLTVDRYGRVLVADTHFYRVLVYSDQGELLFQIGDGVQATTPGRFTLSHRCGHRPGRQLLRGRIRRERSHPGLLVRGKVAARVGRPRFRAGRIPAASSACDRRQRPALRRR